MQSIRSPRVATVILAVCARSLHVTPIRTGNKRNLSACPKSPALREQW